MQIIPTHSIVFTTTCHMICDVVNHWHSLVNKIKWKKKEPDVPLLKCIYGIYDIIYNICSSFRYHQMHVMCSASSNTYTSYIHSPLHELLLLLRLTAGSYKHKHIVWFHTIHCSTNITCWYSTPTCHIVSLTRQYSVVIVTSIREKYYYFH